VLFVADVIGDSREFVHFVSVHEVQFDTSGRFVPRCFTVLMASLCDWIPVCIQQPTLL